MTDIRPEDLCSTISGLEPRCGGTVVVAIDGPSGAGKTRLARELAGLLQASILHFDHVYQGWEDLAETPPRVARDVLEPISRGEPGRIPRWDWGDAVPGDDLVVMPGGILVLDGCGSGAGVIRPYLSYLIWMDAPVELRRSRAASRDDDYVDQWWNMWAAQEADHFAAEGTEDAANVTIHG